MSKDKTFKEMSAEEVMKEFDRESGTRQLSGMTGKLVSLVCILFSSFLFYTAIFGVLDAQLHRAVHLAFGLFLIYVLYPARADWSRRSLHYFDAILAVVATCTPMYIFVNYELLVRRS